MNALPKDTLRLGLPSGSMQKSTYDLFDRAGYHVRARDRSVFPSIDDDRISCVLFRAQEMSRYVADGLIDCGLTGHDWIVENGNADDVVEVCELTYSRATRNPRPVGSGRPRRVRRSGGPRTWTASSSARRSSTSSAATSRKRA